MFNLFASFFFFFSPSLFEAVWSIHPFFCLLAFLLCSHRKKIFWISFWRYCCCSCTSCVFSDCFLLSFFTVCSVFTLFPLAVPLCNVFATCASNQPPMTDRDARTYNISNILIEIAAIIFCTSFIRSFRIAPLYISFQSLHYIIFYSCFTCIFSSYLCLLLSCSWVNWSDFFFVFVHL